MTLTHTYAYTFPVTGKCPNCGGARSEIHVAKGEMPTYWPAAYFEAPRYQRCNLCCPCGGHADTVPIAATQAVMF